MGWRGWTPLIGIDVAEHGALIRSDGTQSARISAIGPVSRAGVLGDYRNPDIREQAAALSARIVGLVLRR